ncbi:hypothetical protein PYCC9005_002432 [Savitreella phatthalungensis]
MSRSERQQARLRGRGQIFLSHNSPTFTLQRSERRQQASLDAVVADYQDARSPLQDRCPNHCAASTSVHAVDFDHNFATPNAWTKGSRVRRKNLNISKECSKATQTGHTPFQQAESGMNHALDDSSVSTFSESVHGNNLAPNEACERPRLLDNADTLTPVRFPVVQGKACARGNRKLTRLERELGRGYTRFIVDAPNFATPAPVKPENEGTCHGGRSELTPVRHGITITRRTQPVNARVRYHESGRAGARLKTLPRLGGRTSDRPVLTDEQAAQVIARRRAGANWAAAARVVGMPWQSVRAQLQRIDEQSLLSLIAKYV